MEKRICAVDDCGSPVERREWCKRCYYRLKADGAITNLPRLPPLRDRYMDAVTITPTGCWEWQRAKNNYGYGQLLGPDGKLVYVHRFSYEKHRGAIPAGFDLDHLCRNPPCCNPGHLEPVTHRENIYRADSADIATFLSGKCRRGHEMSGDNIYRSPTVPGKRDCRTCMRIRECNRKQRRRKAA